MAVQQQRAPKFDISLECDPPATLWPRLPASDKRLGCDLLDRFALAALSSSKTVLLSTREVPGGFALAAARAKFPRKMKE
jgi:hypothetical protein